MAQENLYMPPQAKTPPFGEVFAFNTFGDLQITGEVKYNRYLTKKWILLTGY